MIPAAHEAVLHLLVERLPLGDVNWALTGSTAHALQGVQVAVHDVDVQTDERGARRAALLLDAWCVAPLRRWESESMRSLLARYVIGGIEAELIGAVQKRARTGDWGPAADPAAHRRFVELDGLRVPVLDLEYEARAYAQLGRHQRAELLRRHALAGTVGWGST